MGAVLTVVALACTPVAVTVARGGHDVSGAVAMASIGLGAVVAFAVDDPAANLLAAVPTPLWVYRSVRVLATVMFAIAGGTAVAVMRSAADAPPTPLGDALVVAATAAGVALAIAGTINRRTRNEAAGVTGVAAAAFTMVLVTALAVRFPWLPSLAGGPHHSRWLGLAAIAWAVTVWSTRDPAARRAAHFVKPRRKS